MYKLLCILLLIFSIQIQAKSIKNTNYGHVVVSEITSVYDGDTFRCNIKGYPSIIGKHIGIRVARIDTPEIKGQCKKEKELARAAKQLTKSILKDAKKIELLNMKRGKYFRIVADVVVDEQLLSDLLIKNKLAVAYDGGTKTKDWCK